MNSSRRRFLSAGLQLASVTGLRVSAGGLGAFAAPVFAKTASITAQPLAAGITLLSGAGCNVVAVKGSAGSLLIDGGHAKQSKALLKSAASATGNRQVGKLINTHWHPAQTGSNEAVGKAGGEIIAHEVSAKYLARAVTSVDYAGKYGPLSPSGRPTRTTRTGDVLSFDTHAVHFGYLPAAHTNGDLYVHLPEQNLLITGGPVTSESWPLLDYRNGAWLGGLVKAHEKLAALVRADTIVVPALGRVLTGAELKQQHEMIAAFHEQMVVFQNRGMDTGDCIAASPLKEHEARYGDASAFIIGAFHSLNLAYSPD